MRAALLTALLLATPAAWAGDYAPCGTDTTDPGILSCIDNKTRVAEQRMATALVVLQRTADRGQQAPLRTAQRAWMGYRRANCAFYEAQDGSVSRLKAAECRRVMTEARAAEFEEAVRP